MWSIFAQQTSERGWIFIKVEKLLLNVKCIRAETGEEI